MTEQYQTEVQAKWGQTEAYRQYRENTKAYTQERWDALGGDMDRLMAAFGDCMKDGGTPDSAQAQQVVKQLQEHITAHYYTCTDRILAGLGKMYTGDERFRDNIDRHAAGTAAFIEQAIDIYCRK